MERQLCEPQVLTADFSKPEVCECAVLWSCVLALAASLNVYNSSAVLSFPPQAPLQIHITMMALDAFQEQQKRLPKIG